MLLSLANESLTLGLETGTSFLAKQEQLHPGAKTRYSPVLSKNLYV